MNALRRLGALMCLAALAACAGTAPSSQFAPVASSSAHHLRPHAEASPGNGASALPGAILPCVLSLVSGQASCTIAINADVPALLDPNAPLSLIAGLTPSQIRNLYNLPRGHGTTVAIVTAYDAPTAEADLLVYRTTFGLPACTSLNRCFHKVNQSGGGLLMPLPNLNWAQEAALDLEMVSATCPKCDLLLVEANSASIDDLGAAVDRAVAMGATVVSNSYYAGEWTGELAEDAHYNHPGVAITASSGDEPLPYYPAASPYVTAVGGTSVTGSNGNWTEAPWASGGQGCSAYEPAPAFQSASGCATRATVDVSAVANPQTGVAMFCVASGGWVVAGGTSAGAPIVAGAYALGTPQGPAFAYQNPGAFHDIPPQGYDLATGLGSPNGVAGL